MNISLLFSITMVAVWRLSTQKLLPWKLNTTSACYGNTAVSAWLHPTCLGGERIAIDNLYAMAKPVSISCPQYMTTINMSLFDKCCKFHQNDCVAVYHGLSRLSYFQNITGLQQGKEQVTYQEISSDCLSNNLATTYMLMEFYCIKNSLVANFDSNQPITAPAVYLSNTEYPNTIQDGSSSVTCSVSVSCNFSILVTAIDLQLHNDSTTCTQTLDVIDGNNIITFKCNHNNQYNITTIYSSSSHFIKVVFKKNKNVNGGKLWLQFNATTSNTDVTISCGSSVVSAAPMIYPCASTTTAGTVTTTSSLYNRLTTEAVSQHRTELSSWITAATEYTKLDGINRETTSSNLYQTGSKTKITSSNSRQTGSVSSKTETPSSKLQQTGSSSSKSETPSLSVTMRSLYKDNPTGLHSGTLAVAIVIPLCVLLLILMFIVYFIKKSKEKREQDANESCIKNRISCFGALFVSNRVASLPEPSNPSRSVRSDSESVHKTIDNERDCASDNPSDNYPQQIDFDKLPSSWKGNSLPPLLTTAAPSNGQQTRGWDQNIPPVED